jgi:hypothetical protein
MVAVEGVAVRAPDMEDSEGAKPDGRTEPAIFSRPSNRRVHGGKVLRASLSAAQKLNMADVMHAKIVAGCTPSVWNAFVLTKWKNLRLCQLKRIMRDRHVWKERVEILGSGLETRFSKKGRIKAGLDNGRGLAHGSTGKRKKGGGRKDVFCHIKARVKRWLEVQRARCHHVDCNDLVEVFVDEMISERDAAKEELRKRLLPKEKADAEKEAHDNAQAEKKAKEQAQDEIDDEHVRQTSRLKEGLESKHRIEEVDEDLQEDGGIDQIVVEEGDKTLQEVSRVKDMATPDLKEWIQKIDGRMAHLSNPKYRKGFSEGLVRQIDAVLLKPSVLTQLSMEAEATRVKLGWMLWDYKMWTAAFGTDKDLKPYVQPTAAFIENREKTVIGMSDQIPIWVKIGRSKQVYMGSERLRRKRQKTSHDPVQPGHGVEGQRISAAPVLPIDGTAGSTLTRQNGDATQEKFRITYEARQIIRNYFNKDLDPKGELWKGALIIKGCHGRLDNISDEGSQNLQTQPTTLTHTS